MLTTVFESTSSLIGFDCLQGDLELVAITLNKRL